MNKKKKWPGSVEADLPRTFSNVLAAKTPGIGANANLKTAPLPSCNKASSGLQSTT